ncbi:MAG: alpha/beta hydrolase [Actinobacteria bacterium]|nr:alpha/beta hydrolase [Actinomycetota bacterium]
MLELGDRHAPAVVLAHGVGSSARFLVEAFGAPAVEAGHRLIAYDLRGHGSSSPARSVDDHGLEAHIADMAEVVEEVGAQIVGGVSLGAHVAMTLAAEPGTVNGRDHQVTPALHDRVIEGAVACLPAWIGRARPGHGPHAVVADEIRRVGIEAALDRATSDPDVPSWLRDLLRRDWREADPGSLEAALVALEGGRAPDVELLTSVPVPVGVVGWPDDPGHPLEVAQRWSALVQRGSLVTTTMDEVGRDREALGRAAFHALDRAVRT